jgi:hypothetical protein
MDEKNEFPILTIAKSTGSNIAEKAALINDYTIIPAANGITLIPAKALAVSVYDLTGRVVFAANATSELNIPLNKGIYVLNANAQGSVTTSKIIVK